MLSPTVHSLRRPLPQLLLAGSFRSIHPRSFSLQTIRLGLRLGQHPPRTQQSLSLLSLARYNTIAPDTSTPITEQVPNPRSTTVAPNKDYVYNGPLTKTFKRLKLFSLSSLIWSFAVSPLLVIMETASGLPMVARLSLAAIAITTSGVSTALIGWCGKPYVSTLRFLPPPPGIPEDGTHKSNVLEMTTLTMTLQPRITTVYDTAFLVPTSRPFAKWELAEVFRLPPAEVEIELAKGNLPRDETVAETRDKKGGVVGRWVVQWDENGQGTCYEIGQVAKYFNIHDELLDRPLR